MCITNNKKNGAYCTISMFLLFVFVLPAHCVYVYMKDALPTTVLRTIPLDMSLFWDVSNNAVLAQYGKGT